MKGRRIQWTIAMNVSLLELYEQLEPSHRGYVSHITTLWEAKFPDLPTTGTALSTRLSRLLKQEVVQVVNPLVTNRGNREDNTNRYTREPVTTGPLNETTEPSNMPEEVQARSGPTTEGSPVVVTRGDREDNSGGGIPRNPSQLGR